MMTRHISSIRSLQANQMFIAVSCLSPVSIHTLIPGCAALRCSQGSRAAAFSQSKGLRADKNRALNQLQVAHDANPGFRVWFLCGELVFLERLSCDDERAKFCDHIQVLVCNYGVGFKRGQHCRHLRFTGKVTCVDEIEDEDEEKKVKWLMQLCMHLDSFVKMEMMMNLMKDLMLFPLLCSHRCCLDLYLHYSLPVPSHHVSVRPSLQRMELLHSLLF